MTSYINTNISSLTAQTNLGKAQNALSTSMQRLSSGMRINSAADDAAGSAVSTRLTSQINGLGQATLNANDAISLTQTADTGMESIVKSLQSMRTLSVQASNSTYTASDRASMNAQVKQLKAEIDRVAGGTNFNGLSLLDGSFNAQTFQVAAGNTADDAITVSSISSLKTTDIGGVGYSNVAVVNGVKPTAALTAGDLTLNGVQVSASKAGSMAGQSASSAFAVAKAINTANTGVTATADVNTMAGIAPTAHGKIAANAFSVNGVNVGEVADGTTTAGQGANLAAAINKVSTQTGVTANADATSGAVTLTANDGRDVAIGLNNVGNTLSDGAAAKTARDTFLTQTGFSTASVGTQTQRVATTVASGTFGGVDKSFTATAAYNVEIDSKELFSTDMASTDVKTAADLDVAWTKFTHDNAGYSMTGSFAAGTAQISKADGTAISIVETDGSSAAAADAGQFGGAGFVGLTTANDNSSIMGKPSSTKASGAFDTATGSSAAPGNFKLEIDGTVLVDKAGATTDDVVAAADLDAAWQSFAATDKGKGYSMAGSFATSDAVITKADGTDINIALTNTFATPGTGFDTAGFVGVSGNKVGTSTKASGAFVGGAATSADQVFKLEIDGNTVLTKTASSVPSADTVTAAELDSGWEVFAKTNAGAGYSMTGSFQGGDAIITKRDGTAINIAVTDYNATNANTFGGGTNGFVGVTSGNQVADAQENHGSISLDSASEAGIVVGGTHTAYAGLSSGTTTADPANSTTVTTIASVNVSSRAGAQAAIAAIDGAIATVSENQGYIGALQNRFSSAIENLQSNSLNLSSARMRVRDVDFASETANMTRAQVLSQASMAILGQANQQPSQVMALLR
ncbi:MAG: flagellin [Proteobacteria bacterium]|nr:flagellin [Pseudomonadota bacterium]